MLKTKGRVVFLVIMLLLSVVLCVLCVHSTNTQRNMPFYFTIAENKDCITCWENNENDVYVFLPSYAELEKVYIQLNTSVTITIDNIVITDGMSCDPFEVGIPYELAYSAWGHKHSKKLFFMRSSSVGTMFINTSSGNMDYVHEAKENNEDGTIRVYTQDGKINYDDRLLSISGRGNATWTNYVKKPYSIKLETDADLLGLGSAQKWILFANAADASHMRNKIVYDFSEKIGISYSPDSQWIDLYLNGEYAGLYLLCERNEIHSERVNLSEDHSILVSIDVEQRMIAQQLPYIKTQGQQALRIHSPVAVTEDLLEQLTYQFQRMEDAILSEDNLRDGSAKELGDLIDSDSWILNYLVDEIFGNLDGFLASRYFYIDVGRGDEKIYAGPVWDYDKAVGNDEDPTWSISNPNVLVLNRYFGTQSREINWAEYLYQHSWFRESLVKTFSEVMKPAVDELLNTTIDSYAQQIENAVQLDYLRWEITQDCNFHEETARLVSYIKDHMDFLVSIWIENKDICQVRFIGGGNDLFYSVNVGGTIDSIPCINDIEGRTFCGWYYSNTDEPFDINQPITEDLEIYAKWVDNFSKRIEQVIELLPLATISVIGIVLVGVEVRRWRKCR